MLLSVTGAAVAGVGEGALWFEGRQTDSGHDPADFDERAYGTPWWRRGGREGDWLNNLPSVPLRMELEIVDGVLLVAGGLFAGFVNTVAGGGSAITLPLLVEVLNDPLLANGTNRVAVLLQNSVGLAGFQRGRVVPWSVIRRLAVPVLVGALAGSWVATRLDPGTMEVVFAVVIVGVGMSVLVSPKRWEGGGEARLGNLTELLVFTVVGFYGGFIQAGVGFLILAGLVLGGGLNLVSGNAVKVALILAFTLVALPVFVLAGQVSLLTGLILALGNMTGAWIASNLAVSRGGAWIRWVVVIAALAAAVRMLLR